MSRAVTLKCALILMLPWCAAEPLGCSADSTTPSVSQPVDKRAPRALAVFYQEFMSSHGGRPPQDEAEFREFLGTLTERLQAGGLDADKVLTAPQGGAWIIGYGQPFEVEGQRIIAYSSTSVDGKRSAVNERGAVQQIEEAKLPMPAP